LGFFDSFKLSRLKEGLAKTRDTLVAKVNRLIFAKGKIDDEFLAQLEEILITSDVGVETSHRIIDRIKQRTREQKYETQEELNDLVRTEITNALIKTTTQYKDPFEFPSHTKPYVIMVVGVNGVGKTTTIGKLAHNYKGAGKNVLIGAADTFRAAANEQLEVWGKTCRRGDHSAAARFRSGICCFRYRQSSAVPNGGCRDYRYGRTSPYKDEPDGRVEEDQACDHQSERRSAA
jgi:fused signal recognition particle receptor